MVERGRGRSWVIRQTLIICNAVHTVALQWEQSAANTFSHALRNLAAMRFLDCAVACMRIESCK